VELVAIVGAVALALESPTTLMLIARNPVITARANLEVPKMNDVERDCM